MKTFKKIQILILMIIFVFGSKIAFADETVTININVSNFVPSLSMNQSVYTTSPNSSIEIGYDTNLSYCGFKSAVNQEQISIEEIDTAYFVDDINNFQVDSFNDLQPIWLADPEPFSYMNQNLGSYDYELYCFNPDSNSLLSTSFTVNVVNSPLVLNGTSWSNTVGSGRDTVWVNENVSDNMIVYTGANYQLSWSATSMNSCKLDNVSVALSGVKNDYTAGVGGWSKVHGLDCISSTGETLSKDLIVSVPPNPTNGSGSCSLDGTSGSFSWTAPTGYNTFYTRLADDTGSLTSSDGWNDNFVGTTKTFTATPGKTYNWWVHSKSANGAWSDDLGGVINCPVSSYTISAISSSGGSISPSGSVVVNTGENKTFSYSPSSGYFLSSLLVDGVIKNITEFPNSYTFSNVSSNHEIYVSFSETNNTCSNGATNYPLCTLICKEECSNGAANYPECTLCRGGLIVKECEVCPPVKECLDGLDNDKDGKLDLEDTDCVGKDDDTEGKGFIYKEN